MQALRRAAVEARWLGSGSTDRWASITRRCYALCGRGEWATVELPYAASAGSERLGAPACLLAKDGGVESLHNLSKRERGWEQAQSATD